MGHPVRPWSLAYTFVPYKGFLSSARASIEAPLTAELPLRYSSSKAPV